MTPAEVLDMMHEHRLKPQRPFDEDTMINKSTVNRRADAEGLSLISDVGLFQLLGARRVRALDHSDYEGAEVIHDLTKPVPEKLIGIADFIVDGSTLDNVFDPVSAIRNFAKLLRPRGRIIMINMLSNHNEPYTLLTPLWYLDYFVINRFVDCKVYICVFLDKSINYFCVNIDDVMNPERGVSNFVSPHGMGVIVIAEKGNDSTSERLPAQGHYRSPEEWIEYRESLKRIKESRRPQVVRSTGELGYFYIRRGHLFVNENYEAVDVSGEMRRLGVDPRPGVDPKLPD